MTETELPDARLVPGRRWAAICLLGLAIFYALAVNGQWAVKPDSALYLTLGRSLAEGRGMEYNGRQLWGIPPGVPAMAAACRLATGGDGLWLLNDLMSAMAVATAALTLGIVRRLAAERPDAERQLLALATMLVVGLSARLFGDATLVLTDVPCTMFLAAALYAMLRGRAGHWLWWLAAGAAMAAATWMRLLAAPIGVAMIAGLLLDRWPGQGGLRRRAVVAAIVLAMVAAGVVPWLVALRGRADAGTPDYLAAAEHMLERGSRWGAVGAETVRIPAALFAVLTDQKAQWVNLVAAALIAVGLVAAASRRQWVVVLPVAGLLAFLVVWGGGAVAARYLMPILPLVAYLLLTGTDLMADILARSKGQAAFGGSHRAPPREAPVDAARRGRRTRVVAVMVAAGVCIAISVPKDIRQIWWMRQGDFYVAYEKGRWQGWVEASARVRSQSEPGDAVLTPEWTIVHYLTGRRVIEAPVPPDAKPEAAHRSAAEKFAAAAVRSGARFVVVRADGDGSDVGRRIPAALGATGAFESPPKTFANVAVFERVSGASLP